jgi:hypothetical protein
VGGNGSSGSYPTSATTAAAQLASDTAAVTAVADGIVNTVTVLGVTGTINLPLEESEAAATQLAADVAAVTSHASGISTGTTLLGVTGTLTLPAAGNVVTSNGAYGVGGTGSTPALTLPAVADVLASYGSWGVGGNGSTGTLTLPATGDVVSGISYGVGGNGSTGNYPTTAATQAAQLAADTSAVRAGQTGITTATTILGITGTLPTNVKAFIRGRTLGLVGGAGYSLAAATALLIPLPAGFPRDSADVCSLAVGPQLPPSTTPLLAVDGTFVQQGTAWYAQFQLTPAQTEILAGGALEVQRNWDLLEILADGSELPIYVASDCTVKSLLQRSS